MTWHDDFADAVNQPPSGSSVKVAAVTEYVAGAARSVSVSWEGCDPAAATWSSAFDLALATKGQAIVGAKVLALLIDGQPFVSDLIIGS